ncbi:MAG: hypothetical protein K9N38_01130 [Candidatus Marinimicrobia bacterium]|nr:hypothetical protein [Candidatus Neomarinimicrobiota bacterium]MCF7850028.1 hypothetical protein [Candidatus Neomarinimicrobiota bacterium]
MEYNIDRNIRENEEGLILIVDTNPETSQMTSNLLKIYGFQTIATDKSSGTHSLCRDLPISIIIADKLISGLNDINYSRKIMIDHLQERFIGIPNGNERDDRMQEEMADMLSALLSVNSYN